VNWTDQTCTNTIKLIYGYILSIMSAGDGDIILPDPPIRNAWFSVMPEQAKRKSCVRSGRVHQKHVGDCL
jgi:hypothetical protein